MQDPDELVGLLHSHGLRATPQRRAIIDAVHTAGGHVTAETVFDWVRTEMPTISLRTVYETLHCLVSAGEMREVVLAPGPLRFDTNVGPHHHLICLRCHRIEDIDMDVNPIAVDELHGFSFVRTEVIVWGYCPDCEDQVQ
ncbi:MAG: transcriptional repressor [Acidimicrobiaceae bacterium]|nr:transcriptional repressor [Acidimicrobiaceae bacterium]